MSEIERKVYTIQEVAKMLGISQSHAYAMAKQRIIPVLDVGNRKLVPITRFENWLKGNTEKESQ